MRVRQFVFLAITTVSLVFGASMAFYVVSTGPVTFHGHTELICDVAASPDGKSLASVDRANTIKVWDVATRKERFTLQGIHAVYSPDSKLPTPASAPQMALE